MLVGVPVEGRGGGSTAPERSPPDVVGLSRAVWLPRYHGESRNGVCDAVISSRHGGYNAGITHISHTSHTRRPEHPPCPARNSHSSHITSKVMGAQAACRSSVVDGGHRANYGHKRVGTRPSSAE